MVFQSTHPARGATAESIDDVWAVIISIHAPREGCDDTPDVWAADAWQFQSTHPARGATIHRATGDESANISIHAPREGCDWLFWWQRAYEKDFNPRTPRGVRLVLAILVAVSLYFNPRTPRGVRRGLCAVCPSVGAISIHAPREGCDGNAGRRPGFACLYFNPRTPRGVRQQTLPKSREFAWLNLLICTRGRRLSIRKQTRLCSMKLSFMLFGCEPAGEGVSSWTSHATKSKVRLEGRSAYSQSVRSSAHSDFPGNKSGGCPVRDP